MGENKKELEWKNHAPFYVNLNNDLNYLKHISMNKDMSAQREYYKALSNFKTHYCVYVKTKEIEDKLKECREVLYSTKFSEKKWDVQFHSKVLKIMDLLEEIHEDIIMGVNNSDLTPQYEVIDLKAPAASKQKR